MNYQWNFNGAPISGETTSSLVLTNVQRAQAGTYAVLVTNASGSVLSSNAQLAVNFLPAQVLVGSSTVGASGVVTFPILVVANGNENALGFSVSFDPSKLTYVGASLGAGASGATLNVNSGHAGSGQLGFALALGSGR